MTWRPSLLLFQRGYALAAERTMLGVPAITTHEAVSMAGGVVAPG
ncbi:MAG: hypothetical protein ACXVBG_25105 [Isosphaeraceae bacterium]